jgi:hypothetical protein
MVNPTKTPMANSGTRAFISPLAAISSTADSSPRDSTPYRYTSRVDFTANWCGRQLSSASSRIRVGRLP